MADISNVQQHARFEGWISPGGHLPQSGYARLHLQALLVSRPVLFHVLEWVRARPNQTHVPLQHVPQLWQLIQAVLAQKSAETRDPRIVCDFVEGAPALVQMTQCFSKPICPAYHGA